MKISTLIPALFVSTSFVAAQANDECANAIPVPDSNPIAFDTSSASQSAASWTCAGGGGPDLWYTTLVASSSQAVEIETCGSSYDTALQVFAGSCGSLQLLSCNDDSCGFQSRISVLGQAAGTQLFIRVGGYNNAVGSGEITVTGGFTGPGPIGDNFCSGNPNSSGSTASISADGLLSAASNDVTLTATGLPSEQFGIFMASTVQAFVPNAGGASNGNLCLGGQINRFWGPGQVLSSGAAGEFSLTIDLAAFPMGNSFGAVIGGDTWHFQAWHRDTVGQRSNMTDGISITFND